MDSLGDLSTKDAIPIDDPELWDPEIVAALDDDAEIDESPDNELDDDFISKAIGGSRIGSTNSDKKKKNMIIIKDNDE